MPVTSSSERWIASAFSAAPRGTSITSPDTIGQVSNFPQNPPRFVTIFRDLRFQRIEAVELRFGPKVRDEFDRHVLAVEIAVEVEEIGFQHRRVDLEHRA